jgi:DMSO reductase anchor subunit
MDSESKAAIATVVFLAAMILPWVYKFVPKVFEALLIIAAALGVFMLVVFVIMAIYAVFVDLFNKLS